MIRASLKLGVKRILIGIGGSATNDGGVGMARALGFRFLDRHGRELAEGGGALARLDRIDASRRLDVLKSVTLEVACDVHNPFTGPKGAARVYGPQKGATPAMVKQLDANLRQLARVVRRDIGIDLNDVAGAGAAGGLGGGLLAFAGANLRPGVELIMECIQLEKRLRGCDLVITGEGRMDAQTAFGKAPVGVAGVAKKLGIPVVAICGSLGDGFGAVHDLGIDACFGTRSANLSEAELHRRSASTLEQAAEEVARLLTLSRRVFAKSS